MKLNKEIKVELRRVINFDRLSVWDKKDDVMFISQVRWITSPSEEYKLWNEDIKNFLERLLSDEDTDLFITPREEINYDIWLCDWHCRSPRFRKFNLQEHLIRYGGAVPSISVKSLEQLDISKQEINLLISILKLGWESKQTKK